MVKFAITSVVKMTRMKEYNKAEFLKTETGPG